jgi:hypothetical protein
MKFTNRIKLVVFGILFGNHTKDTHSAALQSAGAPPPNRLYNVKFTQWCGAIQQRVGHKGTAPLKTFLDQAIQ